jgi:hypothetical protein
MTCGERAVRCLSGEPVDHIPYGVGLGWSPWPETLERWRVESGLPDLDVQAHFGFEQSLVSPRLYAGLYPPFERLVLVESEEFIVVRDERGITLRDRRDGGSMPEWLGYPVKSAADWERLKVERLPVGEPARLAEDWPAFRAHLERTGEAVQVGWFPYGVFGTPRDLMGVEELLVGFYTQPELIREMMEHLTMVWLALWEGVATEVPIAHVHIWEDMSAKQGALILPRMAREFMMPCRAIISLASTT